MFDATDVKFTKRQERAYQAFILMNDGWSIAKIARELGVSEDYVRAITFVSDVKPNEFEEVSDLERDLASVLNKHSAENGSNTPDFILAEYLIGCLKAFDTATNSVNAWRGVRTDIVGATDT